MRTNLILNADSYKASHFVQYAPGTQFVSAYAEPRVGCLYPYAVYFGLQMFLKDYLMEPIRKRDVKEAKAFWAAHGLPFNEAGWTKIVEQHGGFMPIRIDALPEGTVTPPGTALVQVVNTDPDMPWLTTYLETSILRAVWYPTTVATKSKIAKEIIRASLNRTCEDPAAVLPFRLHDFGGRGVSSQESAGIGGAAHLVNFMGTDTVHGVLYAREFYGEPMAGFSIPAAEHSTITSWGEAGEKDAFANMVTQFGKKGALLGVVSDSYDLERAVRQYWGADLKNRCSRAVRPSSCGQIAVIRGNCCADPQDTWRGLWLHGEWQGIQGSPTLNSCHPGRWHQSGLDRRNSCTDGEGWLVGENVAFGMGAELLQSLNRDTLFFAYKASAVCDDKGVWRDVWKQPKTDSKKTSKRGRQAVYKSGPGALDYKTVKKELIGANMDLLRPVFENGQLLVDERFADIRARADVVIAPG